MRKFSSSIWMVSLCLAYSTLSLVSTGCSTPSASDHAMTDAHAKDTPPNVPGVDSSDSSRANNPKAWHCYVHAATGDFEADGASQLEAHQMVLQNCARAGDAKRCKKIVCQPGT